MSSPLPCVYTPSQIASLWSPSSLPVGLSASTRHALRDAFILLDAAQGGRGVVDITPLQNALEAKEALLWRSDSEDDEIDDDGEYGDGADDEQANPRDEHEAASGDTHATAPPHATRRERPFLQQQRRRMLRCPPRVDLCGLIHWWVRHVGEEAGASRAPSLASSAVVLRTTSQRTIRSPLTRDDETDDARENHPHQAEHGQAERWQPLRALAPREANALGRTSKSGSRISLCSLTSPLAPPPPLGYASDPLTAPARPRRSSFSPTASSTRSSRRTSPVSPENSFPLSPLSDRRDGSRRGARSLSCCPPPPCPTRTASAPSIPASPYREGTRSQSYLTASTCASSSSQSAPTGSHRTCGGREGTLWKVASRANAVLRAFVAPVTTMTMTTTAAAAAHSGRAATATAPLTDAEVELITRAFDGFEEARSEDGTVSVMALADALTELVQADTAATERMASTDAQSTDAAATAAVAREKVYAAAEAMVSLACTFAAHLMPAGGASPPTPRDGFTRAQFICSFVCRRGAFPPALLALLLKRAQPRAATSADSAPARVLVFSPTSTTTTPMSNPTTATPVHLGECGQSHSDKCQQITSVSTSPFELSLLVELLVRLRVEGQPQQKHKRGASHTHSAASSSDGDAEEDEADDRDEDSDSDDHTDVMALDDVLTAVRQGCFSTAFESSVASDVQACAALIALVKAVAIRHALCVSPTDSSVAYVRLSQLIHELTNQSLQPSTSLAQHHVLLPPSAARLTEGLGVLSALRLPRTMLHRLVELFVGLDLHRPHTEAQNHTRAGGSGDCREDGDDETDNERDAGIASTFAVRQLERLRCLRRAIPRTLGYITSANDVTAIHKVTLPRTHRPPQPPQHKHLVSLETTRVFTRLTELARAVVGTASPRLVTVTSPDRTHSTTAVELSVCAFFQHLVSLTEYVPRLLSTPAAGTPFTRVCHAERALRATICALGYHGARDAGALLLRATRFLPTAPTVRAVLPSLATAHDATACSVLLPSLSALVAYYRPDWCAAQRDNFVHAAFDPVLSSSPSSPVATTAATATAVEAPYAMSETSDSGWVDCGVLLTIWLAAVPAVRFPTSQSARIDHHAPARPQPLPDLPLCEEVAILSPFSDVASLYLSLRQMATQANQSRDSDRAAPLHHHYRRVQPIPFTHLHDFLIDVPRLFEVVRCLCWQDEITADFLFLSHTLKATSLTPEGIYVRLSKLHRGLAPRRAQPPLRRFNPPSPSPSPSSSTAAPEPTELPLWTPSGKTEEAVEAEETNLCATAYHLAYPTADVLAATHLFQMLIDVACSASSDDATSTTRAAVVAVPLRPALLSFDALLSRLRARCLHTESCWLHARTNTTSHDGSHAWRELLHCLYQRTQTTSHDDVRTRDATESFATAELSLFDWVHGLLDLGARTAMGEGRDGLLNTQADLRPSQFIRCLLQHAVVDAS